ncbi:MAG: hypothetical protein GJU72_11300 [Acidithiobacillus ferriphilus]|jgi:hypothetical protein|nr:hypothetical protein [Acidithiobacillus ferriphilus]
MNIKLLLYKLTAVFFSIFGIFSLEAGIFYNPVEFGLWKASAEIFYFGLGCVAWYNFFIGKFNFGYYRGHVYMYINSFVFFACGLLALLSVWVYHNLLLGLIGAIVVINVFGSVKALKSAAKKYPHGQDFFKLYFNKKKTV